MRSKWSTVKHIRQTVQIVKVIKVVNSAHSFVNWSISRLVK
jgi:hypothetical protein